VRPALRSLIVVAFAAIASHAVARPDTRPPEPAAPLPPPPGPGDPRRVVAVLDVAVTGVPNDVKEQFQASLETQVDPKRFWIEPRARVREQMTSSTKWTEGCVIGACLAEVKAHTHADLVLLVAINGSGTSFGSVVTLVRTDTGRVLSQRSERCDVCTINEALTTATLATINLLNAVPDKLPDDAIERHAQLDLATGPLVAKIEAGKHHRKKTGIVLAITGAVAAAAGVALYMVNNHADYGLATLAAGGGVAASGVVVLAF
jgi:hypothetical protein